MNDIAWNALKTKSFIVGIAGGTGSGKTTIAAGIAAAIGAERATLIDAESYYADLSHLPLQAPPEPPLPPRTRTPTRHPTAKPAALRPSPKKPPPMEKKR